MIKVWDFEFWMIYKGLESNYEDEFEVQHAYDSNIRRMVRLEQLGFEGIFFSEHHFLNALSPCPNLLIAAVAQHTSRLRLGVLGNVLALHQPFRLAEELAMLDYLTQGRLEIGSAVGVPPEFAFVGIKPEDIRPMYTEIVRILELSRESRSVTFHGKYFHYDDLQAMPRPRKIGRRREWVAAYSPASAVTTAKRNAKLALGFQSTAGMVDVFAAYREAMSAEGHAATPDDMMIRRQVLICDTDAEAAEQQERCLAISRQITAKTFEPVFRMAEKIGGIELPDQQAIASGVKDAQFVPAEGSGPQPKMTNFTDMISPDEYLFGSPQTVAEKIIEQCRVTGAGNIAAYNTAGFDEAQTTHQTELWAKVLPILHSANVLSEAA